MRPVFFNSLLPLLPSQCACGYVRATGVISANQLPREPPSARERTYQFAGIKRSLTTRRAGGRHNAATGGATEKEGGREGGREKEKAEPVSLSISTSRRRKRMCHVFTWRAHEPDIIGGTSLVDRVIVRRFTALLCARSSARNERPGSDSTTCRC